MNHVRGSDTRRDIDVLGFLILHQSFKYLEMARMVHPELMLGARIAGYLPLQPRGCLRTHRLCHRQQLQHDQRQRRQALLPIDDKNPAADDVGDVGVQVVPGIVRVDVLLVGLQRFLLRVGFVELIEDVVQEPYDRLFQPLIVALVEVNEVNGSREHLIEVLFVGLDFHRFLRLKRPFPCATCFHLAGEHQSGR